MRNSAAWFPASSEIQFAIQIQSKSWWAWARGEKWEKVKEREEGKEGEKESWIDIRRKISTEKVEAVTKEEGIRIEIQWDDGHLEREKIRRIAAFSTKRWSVIHFWTDRRHGKNLRKYNIY